MPFSQTLYAMLLTPFLRFASASGHSSKRQTGKGMDNGKRDAGYQAGHPGRRSVVANIPISTGKGAVPTARDSSCVQLNLPQEYQKVINIPISATTSIGQPTFTPDIRLVLDPKDTRECVNSYFPCTDNPPGNQALGAAVIFLGTPLRQISPVQAGPKRSPENC